MRRVFIVAVCLAPSLGAVQGSGQSSSSSQTETARPGAVSYGPLEFTDLNFVVSGALQRRNVMTECEPSFFKPPQFWTCGTDGATVLLIPGKDFDPGELDQALGKRTAVRGIVRALRPKESVGQPPVDRDLVEDPLLPPLPPPGPGWPRVSITVIGITDRSVRRVVDDEEEYGSGISLRILEEPAAYLGKTTKIVGQFRGRNLFGDLPANSGRGKEDWVLRESDGGALWVVGRPPKGQGWKLDLDYKGDSKTWLEVEGKAEVVNGVVYLKASRIIPKKTPRP